MRCEPCIFVVVTTGKVAAAVDGTRITTYKFIL